MAWLHGTAAPKGEKRAKSKARADRAESKVKKAVRAECVERDAHCRICEWETNPDDTHEDDLPYTDEWNCGRSEWAHLESRARTRKMKPERRHSTATSVMLCKFHHDRLDGRARPRIVVTLTTNAGADGPLEWKTR